MFEYTNLRDQLSTYLSKEEVDLISQAYLVAADAHAGQRRRTGEPYVTHPLEVARILANMRLDMPSIAAAILHDVIEDTDVTKDDIAQQFGEEIAGLVDGVSKLTQIEFNSQEEAQAENFRKMMLAMANDIRVIIVKLADRLHNMRTIFGLPKEKRRRIANETLEIYAPIAARLGMNHFRVELEDLGFSALYPMRYRVLKSAVLKARGNRKEIMQTIEETLCRCLDVPGLSKYTIWGREKHLYSLYRKMRSKQLSFIEVMDVYAFRILVGSNDECYRVLGLIHSVYKPVPGRFKDYIAMPKTNNYQSLHTVLLGPYGVPIEVQIRTEEMERLAENGIAAHWLYKSGEKSGENALEGHVRTREWVKGLLEIQGQVGSSLEFIESVKLDLYPDDVYVFTPKGRILALPKGATPVDFAYQVHTDIGNTCVAGRIDRKLAPLSTRLTSGQIVEVITDPEAHPNPAWLNFVVTGKARTHIRHWLKKQQTEQSQALGERMLSNALQVRSAHLEAVSTEVRERVVRDLGLESAEELYQSIGLGQHMASLVAQRLMENKGEESVTGTLNISGTEGMVVTYAKCCYPIPGDPIVGFMNTGRGMVIHNEHCHQIESQLNRPEKCVHLSWATGMSSGEFEVGLRVHVMNQRGVLAKLSTIISDADSNIMGIQLEDKDQKQSAIEFVLLVKGRKHLARIIRRLRHTDVVLRITRMK